MCLDTLHEMNPVTDVSNSTLSIANNTLTVPLIVRFSPTSIVRTIQSVTVDAFHELDYQSVFLRTTVNA